MMYDKGDGFYEKDNGVTIEDEVQNRVYGGRVSLYSGFEGLLRAESNI